MLIFDAPMRESCIVARSRTNTPTQALATLNDPTFVEAARAMAERVLAARKDDAARANYAFLMATSRVPSAKEREVLLAALQDQRAAFRADPERATKLLSVGESPRNEKLEPAEHAAWTMVCNLILNLDEVLTQH
jgi:hypothetical protein